MPRKWSEVVSDPVFQQLKPDQQEAARQQYFNDVVSPQVPQEHLGDAKKQFDADTKNIYAQASDEMSGPQKFIAGIGGGLLGAGQGIAQVAANAGNALGLVSDETLSNLNSDIQSTKEAQSQLNKSGAGLAGNIIGNAAAFAPTALIPGANTVLGSSLIGGIGSALMTPGDLKERAIAGGFGAAGGAFGTKAGQYIGKRLGERSANSAAELGMQESHDAAKNAALEASKQAGYVVPPTQANPTVVNRFLEGAAGKITTAQMASSKNQQVTNKLAKLALGLPDDQPITPGALEALRTQAGTAYETIKAIPKNIESNSQYKNALQTIGNDLKDASKEFPDLVNNKQINNLVSSLDKNEFSPSSAIEVIKKLRFDSKANLKAEKDPAMLALGQAQRKAANAVENLVEDNLGSTTWRLGLIKQMRKDGQQYIDTREMADNFRNARQLIAKAYDVESALNDITGNVSARELGKLLDKGKPLTDELKKAGDFARAFPKAAQDVEKMGSLPGVSPLDFSVGALTGAATSSPWALAGVAARPTIRSIILSKPYQQAMTTPTYAQGYLSSLIPQITNSNISQNTLRALATAGASSYPEQK